MSKLEMAFLVVLNLVVQLLCNLIASSIADGAQQDLLTNQLDLPRLAAMIVMALAVSYTIMWAGESGKQRPATANQAAQYVPLWQGQRRLLILGGIAFLAVVSFTAAFAFPRGPLCAGKPLCVLIAQLTEDDDTYSELIGSRLETVLRDVEHEIPTVKYVPHIKTMQDADALAGQEQALVIVWGQVVPDEEVQDIYFQVLDRLGIDEARDVRTQRAIPILFDETFHRLTEAQAHRNVDVVAYTAAGLLQYSTGRLEQAYDSFLSGLVCAAEQIDPTLLAEIKPVCKEPKAPLEWQPEVLYYYAGKAAILSGDYQRGIELLQTAAVHEPNEPAIMLGIGQAYQEWSGQPGWHKAEQALQQAIDYAVASVDDKPPALLPAVYQDIGLAYELLGIPSNAAASYATAVQRFADNDPRAYVSLVQLGRMQALQDENAAASATLRQAIELDPRAPWAYLEMAKLQRERRDAALEFIDEARLVAPNEAQVDIQLAELCRQWEDDACAEAAYLDAEKKRPNSSWLQGKIGAFYEARQDWEKAETYYANAAARRPRDPWAHERIGYVFFQQGDLVGALDHYAKAIEMAPSELVPARLHCGLGQILQLNDDLEPARQQYELCQAAASSAAEREKARLLLEQLPP